MPKLIKIDYPDDYLFMTQRELYKYALKQITKNVCGKTISIGDKIQIGRPVYHQNNKIIRQAVWPSLVFKRLITPQ